MDFIHDTAHTLYYSSQFEDAMMGRTGSRMCSSSSIKAQWHPLWY